ncbi:protein-glutamate O-methyltransferase [Bradyrhizobium japonicum]|uniref:CheR family methyltransferase n=1 Tax=Bradyrhizobium japonicum TaxID=375 RepID=UPI001BA88029|nr:protein-glutamate O-methyltransferase [Bradyrhizobium japonicum]MBR0993092.1 protein-glutamate O-methyltransferase [Bradyrhizobium japonicum]
MQQEYAIDDGDFRKIVQLVMNTAGIVLSDRKRPFVQSRLGRRLRALGMTDFRQYCRLLEAPAGEEERSNLINAITTNHTSFFREPHHFTYLANTILPKLADGEAGQSRRLRIWSAGCSTGEEPYTIAMTLREHQALLKDWDVKILATDLDTNVVAHAAEGIYDTDRLESVPPHHRKRFVTELDGDRSRMNDEIRSLISFAPLNLLQKWPMQGPFDVIFCRNVVIYFDKPTQRKLFDRYAEILRPTGSLFIGHSESLLNVTDRFDLVGRTIYRRVK